MTYNPDAYIESLVARAPKGIDIEGGDANHYVQKALEGDGEDDGVQFSPVGAGEAVGGILSDSGYPSVFMDLGGSIGKLDLSGDNIDIFIQWLSTYHSEKQLKKALVHERGSESPTT